MNYSAKRTASQVALTAVVLTLAACGPARTDRDTGAPSDATTDESVDSRTGVDAPSDRSSDVIATDIAEVGPVDARDASNDTFASMCHRDQDCAGSPATPLCDLTLNRCAQCLRTSDTCPIGSYCDTSDHCVAGCRDSSDCAGSDAGVACNVATHTCTGCTLDLDCMPGTICTNHACVPGCDATQACPGGQSCCNNVCVDIAGSVDHCGSCTVQCGAANASPVCTAAHCVENCASGFGDCDHDPNTGCESAVDSDPQNCGGCGMACSYPNAMATCSGSTCHLGACDSTHGNCNSNDADGCETNTQTDVNNCGGCGTICAAPTPYCVFGVCAMMPALYHGWNCPIPGCRTNSFDTTSPTVDGGTYPWNTGDSLACRAWKLAATICTTQPTQYSGTTDNWTCPMSGGFTDPVFGTFCPVTTQYSCTTCPAACNAGTCFAGPFSLRNCTGAETRQQ